MRRLALGNLLYLSRYYFGSPSPTRAFQSPRVWRFYHQTLVAPICEYRSTGPGRSHTAVYRNCHSLPHAASWRRPPTTASTICWPSLLKYDNPSSPVVPAALSNFCQTDLKASYVFAKWRTSGNINYILMWSVTATINKQYNQKTVAKFYLFLAKRVRKI